MHLNARDAADVIGSPMPAWKRFIDVTISSTALVVLSPIFLVVALIIKVSSPGPVLLKQTRIGRGRKPFEMWKFRTMHAQAGESAHEHHVSALIKEDAPLTKLDAQDPRVFSAGRIIRRCYLDELPQLVNVLHGEMSLVGPRPVMPYESGKIRPRVRFHTFPGMTGLWQVSGKNKTTFAEMIRLDIAYAENLSLRGDLKILAKTVPVIFAELVERAVRRGEAAQHINAQVMRKTHEL
jgi:lipopolysaccharide/colanic/teichoic acid biosynthesis glycosyltransferase